jgi:hypothetical protein
VPDDRPKVWATFKSSAAATRARLTDKRRDRPDPGACVTDAARLKSAYDDLEIEGSVLHAVQAGEQNAGAMFAVVLEGNPWIEAVSHLTPGSARLADRKAGDELHDSG